MDKEIRTFIAIELTEEIREALKKIQEHFKKIDLDVRWVKPQNIHLTLKFLGNIPPKKIKAVTETFPSLFSGLRSFGISITHLGVFPKPERPRVIWAGIEKNADYLKAIAFQVENGLCKSGFPKEKRGFAPHLTIGRVRSLKNYPLLSKAIAEYAFPVNLTQTVERITLFKSTLAPQGSIYDPLSVVELR